MKCLLLLGRLHNKKNNPSAARHFLEEIISMEMNPRIWSWDQRRYVARACYLLIPVLLDEGEMEHATSVYEHGLYCMAPDDYIKSKYERLGTLLQEAKKRYQGVFVRVVAERGFGFIDCREVSEDAIFAHLYDIVDEIGDDFSAMINVWVSFSIEKTEKGLAAKGIRILH